MENQILTSLMTGKLKLCLGCRQSMKLKGATAKIIKESEAESGSIGVSAKLWSGSKKVTALARAFTAANISFNSITLPWSDGVRIFKSWRIDGIYRIVRELIATTDPLIADIVSNYDVEKESAVIGLGHEGNSNNYPISGVEFEGLIVRRFNVDTIGTSNAILELVGGALGEQLSREHEQSLRDSIGQAQGQAAERLVSVLRRMVAVCDPNKGRTRVTDSLINDLREVTTNLSQVLLFPNDELEMLNDQIIQTLGDVTRDQLADNPTVKLNVYNTAKQMADAISSLTVC